MSLPLYRRLILTAALGGCLIFRAGVLRAALSPPQFLVTTPAASAVVQPGDYGPGKPLSVLVGDADVPVNLAANKTYLNLSGPAGTWVPGTNASSGGAPDNSVSLYFYPLAPIGLGGDYTLQAKACGADGQCIQQDIPFHVQDQTSPSVNAVSIFPSSGLTESALSLSQSAPEGPFQDTAELKVVLSIPPTSANTIEWDYCSVSLFTIIGSVKVPVPLVRLGHGSPSDGALHYSLVNPLDGAGLFEIDVQTFAKDGSGNEFAGPPVGFIPPQFTTSAFPTRTPSPSWTASPTDSITPTATPSRTATETPTASPTATVSVTVSPTPSSTASASVTATISPSATVCPTPTRTFSPAPTVTASPGAAPAFASTDLGKPVLGPVPLRAGEPLCLYFDAAPFSSACRVYNQAGQRVADADFGGKIDPCLATGRLAPGLYFVRVDVSYADGSKRIVDQKVAILP